MSVKNPVTDSTTVPQKILSIALGLVLGLVLSITAFIVVLNIGQSQQTAPAINSKGFTANLPNDTDELLERLGFEGTLGIDVSTSELHRISKYLGTLSTENLVRAFSSSATYPFATGLFQIQEILCEYLVEKSPFEALEIVWLFEEHRKEAMLQIVFRDWADQDLVESIQVASGLQSPYRDFAFKTIIEAIDPTDEIVASFASTDISDFEAMVDTRKYEKTVYEIIDQDPNTAFELLNRDEVEDYQQVHLFTLALSELYQKKGMDAIATLHSFSYGSEIFDELFAQIATQDRVGTLDYIQGMRSSQRYRFVSSLIGDWVVEDVDSAFAAVQELSNPSFRADAYRSLVRMWGWTYPIDALDRLDEIPRQFRSAAVFDAVQKLGSTDPETVLRLIPMLKTIPGAFNDENERTFVYSWSSKDPNAALQWIQENVEVGSEKRARMLSRVLGTYALTQPQKAMEIANKEDPNPGTRSWGLTLRVIDSLVNNGQLEIAIGLVDQVPQNLRVNAYAEVAQKLAVDDRFDEVLSLSEELSTTDKLSYFRSVVYGLSREHASDVIFLVGQIPDLRLRSDVLNPLLSEEFLTSRYFTSEQLETLRSLVVE